jgi:hypothetical protein
MVAGCCWLMGQYNVNWFVWLYTKNSFPDHAVLDYSAFIVSLSAQNYGRHGPWEKLLILDPPVSVDELRKIREY